AFAPEAALIFVWTGLAGALAAALTALIGARLEKISALAPSAVATVVGAGWLLGLGHFIFLGVGMSYAGALGLIALLVMVLVRPLAPRDIKSARALAATGLMMLLLGAGAAWCARIAEPPAPS
ncbi:hypothetical protein LTR94_028833, partial [Friedmanniomyces endolithicus]